MIPRLTSRHGRSVLAWYLAGMVVASAGLTLTIERWRPDWSDPEFGTHARRIVRRHAEGPNRPVVLVLGSSRAAYGFATDAVKPPTPAAGDPPLVYNLALSGGGPFMDLLCLKRMLAMGIKPDSVVIEVHPVLLYTDGITISRENFIDLRRIRFPDLAAFRRHTPALAAQRLREWLEWNAVPWYSNRFSLMTRYAPGWVAPTKAQDANYYKSIIHPYGWMRFGLEWVTPDQHARWLEVARQGYQPYASFTEVSPVTDGVMRDLLALCRREGIRVVGLVRMPESTEFRAWYAPHTERVVASYVDGLSREFGVPYIDASGWIPDAGFADGHHLLPGTAYMFTERFYREILGPHFGAGRS
jgi:hypothetical protein